MDRQEIDTLIIGAGMAGLSCATRLAEEYGEICVIDKGRGPGGRMAARRAEIAGETVSFDHGAQYFTARDEKFQKAVAAWEELGVVARWPAAGEDAWVGVPGMNGPIRAMAQELDVRWNTRATSISYRNSRWHVDAGDQLFSAVALLIAVPAEQARELFLSQTPVWDKQVAAAKSEPCWAVMAGFAQPLDIEADTVRDPQAPVSWAARNSAKPLRTGTETWVLHASPERSRELLDVPKEQVGPLLLDEFFRQTGAHPVAPIHLAAHRWLYAMPNAIAGEPARYDAEIAVGLAGDYLHSPRVEGAWLSGHALAEMVLGTYGESD